MCKKCEQVVYFKSIVCSKSISEMCIDFKKNVDLVNKSGFLPNFYKTYPQQFLPALHQLFINFSTQSTRSTVTTKLRKVY